MTQGRELSSYIDHTLLRPDATEWDIEKLCAEARGHQFFGVCVNGAWVKAASSMLKGFGIKVISVAGFPLGAMSIDAKQRETEVAIADGAEEIDFVMNIGRLKQGESPLSVLRSCFPAGTVSGAPKVRAMEIISELEPCARGFYGGAVGYLGFNGALDTCIAIRTLAVHDGTITLQAGAGIVADSVPEREYEETVGKSRALLEALSSAAAGLQALPPRSRRREEGGAA